MFIGIYNLPTLISFSALVLGINACILSYNGYIGYALVCIIWAGIFDLFDGYIARKRTLSDFEKNFGVQIDSILDAINFGAVPAVVALHAGFNSPLDHLILIAYCCAGAMRLGYFNVVGLKGDGPVQYYTGLPITFSAMIFPLAYLVGLYSTGPLYTLTIRAAYITTAFFFVLKIPIPKPKGVFYVIFPILAAAVSAVWLIKG